MPASHTLYAAAWTHHRAGRLVEAEEGYRQVLETQPAHADALHLLGVVLHQRGHSVEAEAYIRRAVAQAPQTARYRTNLGETLRAQRRFGEAADCYRRALELAANDPAALNNLGIALLELSQLDESAACFRQLLAADPANAMAWNNLGNTLCRGGRADDAMLCYRRAVALAPHWADAHCNLGIALAGRGDGDAARPCFARAMELAPGDYAPWMHLGNLHLRCGRLEEAETAGRAALRRAPEIPEVHNNLATILVQRGRLAEAAAHLRRAVALYPDYAAARSNLALALVTQGCVEEGIAVSRQALEFAPHNAALHSNLLLNMQYSPTIAPETLLAEHREFEARHAAALHAAWRPHANDRRADRPLRLGFVSPDFACHPVGMLLVRVLEQLSRDRATLVCYHDREGDDAWTARFRAAATTWHVVRGWTDATLAQQIRDDAIDVLFDLAGHTGGNRLLVFARKPAPIQISWAGYQGTTGLTAMDYLLTDRTAVPVKYESCYVERILRMPDGYACFDPPPDAPPVAPLPAAGGAPFTYASFNNPAKILRPVVEAWAEILRQVPGARLVLKYRGLDDLQVQARYYGWFAAQGIPAERIFLRGSLPWADRLKAYDEVDLCLDPFPYSGSMTTCEALWMGVPVLTWPATLFAGRQTQGHLNCLGLDEFVADSRSDYVRRAVAAAGDLPRLARLRGELRPRMAASPLCDAPRFAENLMRLLRQAWREWVARSDAPPT